MNRRIVLSISEFISIMVALLAILNPIGNVPIYIAMVSDRKRHEQIGIVLQASIAMAIIMAMSVWLGLSALNVFGVSIAAFRLAGGLIVVLIGLDMLRAKSHGKDYHLNPEQVEAHRKESIGVVPIAMPIFAGPGTIATIIGHTTDYNTIGAKLDITFGCIGLAALIGIILWFSPLIARLLGPSGMRVVTRVMGLILMSIAFEMLGSGMKSMLPGLAH
jgi:multiple antibiotic resistance protein